MKESSNTYIPIDCGFYDRLEAWAITKADCKIMYVHEDGHPASLSGRITDVFSRDSEEFIRVNDDQEIRLDRINSVNGIELPGVC